MNAKVRPARDSDRAPLMSFIKDVWGGHDYIPYVWDTWLHADNGRMFVVEVDGKVVGMNRVKFLEDGSAWFEGARVHPDFRGMGLASMLGENSMRVARSRGIGVFRLTSGSTNRTAHRQIARIEFEEAARFSVYEPAKGLKLSRRPRSLRMPPDAIREAMKLIEQSAEFRLGTGVFWHDFSAAALSRDVVGRLLKEGAVWRLGSAVAVRREGGEGSGVWEEVCFLGGAPKEAMALVRSLLGWNGKATERFVFVPQGSPLIHALRQEGFRRNFAMILFERRAANG